MILFDFIQGLECLSVVLRVFVIGGVYIVGGIFFKILFLFMDGLLIIVFENCNFFMCNVVVLFFLIVVKILNVGFFGVKVCCYGCRVFAINIY